MMARFWYGVALVLLSVQNANAQVAYGQSNNQFTFWLIVGGLIILIINRKALGSIFNFKDPSAKNYASSDLFDLKAMRRGELQSAVIMLAGALIGAFLMVFFIAIPIMTAALQVGVAGLVFGFTSIAFMTSAAIVCVPVYCLVVAPWVASGFRFNPGGDDSLVMISQEHPLVKEIHQQCKKLGIPPVKHVGYYKSADINAFAMGTNVDNYTLGFSTGCLKKLTKAEVNAVVGHELGHVVNNDMRRMQYGYAIQDSMTWFMIFYKAKLLARKIIFFITEGALMRLSRQREYWADAVGAALTSPETMQSVLRKIDEDSKNGIKPKAELRKYAGLMFSFPGIGLFSSHPPLQSRVEALQKQQYYKRLPWRQTIDEIEYG